MDLYYLTLSLQPQEIIQRSWPGINCRATDQVALSQSQLTQAIRSHTFLIFPDLNHGNSDSPTKSLGKSK